MSNTLTRRRCWGPVLALTLLMTAGAAATDSWVQFTPEGTLGIKEIAPAGAPQLQVLGYDATGIRLTVHVPGLALDPCKTEQGEFVNVTWPDAKPWGEVGGPALPVMRRLFIAPPGASVALSCQLGATGMIDSITAGLPLNITPRQRPVPKIEGARENMPFDYDPAAYAVDADYLTEPASVQELGIVRGQRLFMLEVHPVAYNPVAQTITFRSQVDVTIRFSGSGPGSGLNPLQGLDRIILNPDRNASGTRGSGNYLIVAPETFETNIASFASAKGDQGFAVTTHVVPNGTSNSVIKDYIEDLWGGPDAPEYILLVGDTNLIPHWVGGGTGSPDTDLPYACMDGATDWYPDIGIGRFPARTTTHLTTLVDKTLYTENGPLIDPDYLKRAVFMASVDNYQISEGTHNYVIDTWLAPNGYLCDKLYQVTYGATTQDVYDSFNDGRFYGVFSGHGSSSGWGDGPPFYQSDVNALTNEGMYSFICSFSCSTGAYVATECFMETWVLAPNKGAVCSWGSSVSSYWDEDDILERVLFDAIFDDADDVKTEAGPIYNESKMRLLDHYGATGMIRRYFEMYNLMGDPSLRLPSACSDAGTVELDQTAYGCESTATIAVADCGLNLDDNLIDTVEVTIASDSEPAGETVTLYETDAASAQFEGSITLSATDSVGVLLVAEDDIVTVTYIDADDGQGGTNVEVTDLALVDCTAPSIWNIQVIDIEPRSATVTFDADETVRGTVQYGLACDDLTDSASGGYGNPASVGLTGLQDDTTYYFIVFAEDEAGNEVTDDNGGACYSFTTPEVPNFFTEQFSSGNDLDYLSLCFTPNGSVDYYAGCAEEITSLPTDPSGGTPLSISEDSYQQVSLGGGETVSLYGTSYSSFYVCDNGYITFTGSDTDYTESLEDHFDMPRISVLFDDLSVDNYDGFVSWKQEADRAVVTYENVPEYGTSNNNTFQVEMYFNGDIRISYLALDADDGLAGLSEGLGLDPDFYETDLSAMGSCGPRPPTAQSGTTTTEVNIAVTVTLTASDDGLPEPPALDYIIVSLPTNGTLGDPGAGIIDSVPYTLVGGGNLVQYDPDHDYIGPDSFTFKANDGGTPPDGGDSNVATIYIEVTPPVPQPVYDFPLDTDPGWSVEGQWAFGQPTGGGSHDGDPSSGHTGSNVYGYNLNGDYAVSMPAYYLTSTAIDCSGLLYVELRFWRWLGVESCNFDHATVEVSNDGSAWTVLWENPLTSISDISWSQMVFNLSAIADGEPTVYLRWSMGPTDPSVTYPGWNIDDIEIWATVAECPGDLDGDNDVDLADLAQLLGHYGTTSGAVYEDGDLDGDGDVDLADLAELLSLYGTTC